jgi:hypothetical protein
MELQDANPGFFVDEDDGRDQMVEEPAAHQVSAEEVEEPSADGGASWPTKDVSEDIIKAFVSGKKARTKAGMNLKVKDIDDYLKLFINAHHLP